MSNSKWSLPGLIALASLVAAGPAAAEVHNTPASTASATITHVTAYAPCEDPQLYDPTSPGVFGPSCPAQRSNGHFSFGKSGQASTKMWLVKPGKPARGTDTPLIPAGVNGPDVLISTTARELLAGGTPYDGELESEIDTRITDAGCAGGASCTLPDMSFTVQRPAGVPVASCEDGKCLQQTTANLAIGAEHPGAGAIAAGNRTSLQLGSSCVAPNEAAAAAGENVSCQGVVAGRRTKQPVPAAFMTPRRTQTMVLPFVRDYRPTTCTDTMTPVMHDAPLAIETCPLLAPASSLKFGSKGRGSVSFHGSASKFKSDVVMTIRLKDVRTATGLLYEGTVTFRTSVRVTHPACEDDAGAQVACTRPDLTKSLEMDCVKGGCKAIAGLGVDLPRSMQSNIEIGTVREGAGEDNCISDAAGGKFACAGLYVP